MQTAIARSIPRSRIDGTSPVLRFHWKWTDHEYNQVRHMQQTFRALIQAMGGQVFTPSPKREEGYGIAVGGQIIHELGGARMGSDRQSSVVDGFSRTHDVPHLFIADGASFVSRPTRTRPGPSWRSPGGRPTVSWSLASRVGGRCER